MDSSGWGLLRKVDIQKKLGIKSLEMRFLFACWEELSLILSVSNNNLIVMVPSHLPSIPQNLKEYWPKFASGPQLSRIYTFEYLDSIIFHKLITKLLGMEWKFLCCWNRGVIISVREDVCLIETDSNTGTMIIHVRGETCGISLFTILECFESLFERNLNAKVFVPCIHCINNPSSETHLFTLEECEEAYSNGENMLYCNDYLPIDLYSLAPDVAMNNINQFTYEEVCIQNVLGEGSYAVVHKALYKNELVALKELILGPEEEIEIKPYKQSPNFKSHHISLKPMKKSTNKKTTLREKVGYEENNSENNLASSLPSISPFKSLQGKFSGVESASPTTTRKKLEMSPEVKGITRSNTMLIMPLNGHTNSSNTGNNTGSSSAGSHTSKVSQKKLKIKNQEDELEHYQSTQMDMSFAMDFEEDVVISSPLSKSINQELLNNEKPSRNSFLFIQDSSDKKTKNLGTIFGKPSVRNNNSFNLHSIERRDSFAFTDRSVNKVLLKLYTDFRREVCLMTMLKHPNVVSLKGICRSPLSMMMEVKKNFYLFLFYLYFLINFFYYYYFIYLKF